LNVWTHNNIDNKIIWEVLKMAKNHKKHEHTPSNPKTGNVKDHISSKAGIKSPKEKE